MICKNCGNNFEDSYEFCPACGAANEEAGKEEIRVENSEKQDLERKSMMWSVLSLAVAICGPVAVDIVFAYLARKCIGRYTELFGEPQGALVTGKNMSLAALIIGIIKAVSTVGLIIFYIFYFIFIFMMATGEMFY